MTTKEKEKPVIEELTVACVGDVLDKETGNEERGTRNKKRGTGNRP